MCFWYQATPVHIFTSLSIKSLIYFCFLSLVLISDYRINEKYRLSGLVNRQLFSSYLIKGLIYFCFWNTFLINDYNASERFLKRRSLSPHFSPYPLRGKFIFLKFYRSDTLVFMTIEKILKIGLVGLVISLSYP